MSADDEKALTWDEVSDPTHAAGSRVEPASVVEPVETKPASVVEPAETPAEPKPPTSSFLLVSYGIHPDSTPKVS